jgi:hypothetical protein
MAKDIWRRIIDYPDYEVNQKGHVRLASTRRRLIHEKGLIGNVVKLWHNGDAKRFRTSDLVAKYFPDEDKYGGVEWRTLEKFPDYEINTIGIVRNLTTKYELPILQMKGYEAKVALWKDGERSSLFVKDLLAETFSEVKTEG